nr:ribonuclease H-like domain-containing protein [Tanacetum cinerariifolium]
MKQIAIKELRWKLEVAQKEKDGIQVTVEKLKNASKSLNKLIDCQIVDNYKKGLGYESYNAVPPPYIGNFMPPKPDLSYTGLDEFAIKPVVENKSSKEETKAVRKNTDAPIIKEWMSDDEEKNVDSDAAHIVAALKVPMLKPGEFELWRMRIDQYIQMMDYALWDVIVNGNSIPKTQTINNVETVIPLTSAKEKLQRRNEVKERSTLMMGLLNEHQLKFNSFKDAKSLLEAIEKSANTQNMAFVSSSSNNSNISNGVNTALGVNTANKVNTASFQVNAASSLNIDNMSDEVICAFLESRCHKKDCASRDTKLLSIVSYDGLGGYDWSDQAEEGPTNYALIDYFTSSTSSSDSECEGPLRGGFCWFCASRVETSFANDPNPNPFDDSQNLSDYSPQSQYETYRCELCGNDSHYGYDCPPRFPLVYEQEPCYNQNYNENYYPHNWPSFLCCDNCGVPHESFQCQSMNQNYFEHNPCYDSKFFGFDQFQSPQYFDVHQLSKEISIDELNIMMQSYCERMNQQREHEALLVAQEKEETPQNSDFRQLIGEICGTKVCEEQKQKLEDTMLELLEDCRKKELYCMHNNVDDLIESVLNSKLLLINLKSQHLDKEKREVKNIVEQAPKCRTLIAIAPVLQTKEPDNSLSMGDEHLSTISKTKSDEVIKSSVENLVLIPSEFEDFSDNESKYDVPICDDFMTFSNPLFDCNNDFTSSDDKSLSNEDVPMIYSNSLFDDEEIIPIKIDPHYFNAESNLLESLLNQDTLIDSSPKFDYILEEFSGELTHINPIPPGIEEANFDLEKEIRLVENLLYDNSSPRPPEELNAEIADTIVESLSLSLNLLSSLRIVTFKWRRLTYFLLQMT